MAIMRMIVNTTEIITNTNQRKLNHLDQELNNTK